MESDVRDPRDMDELYLERGVMRVEQDDEVCDGLRQTEIFTVYAQRTNPRKRGVAEGGRKAIKHGTVAAHDSDLQAQLA